MNSEFVFCWVMLLVWPIYVACRLLYVANRKDPEVEELISQCRQRHYPRVARDE